MSRRFRVLLHRLRSRFRRSRAEAEMRQEIAFHLEQLVREGMASGLSEAEARRRAHREFGSVDKTEEECRDTRGIWIENVARDVRHGLRSLARDRSFTVAAVITLALGIAVNTTMFSAVSASLLRKPPVKDPDRLCVIASNGDGHGLVRASALDFLSWQKQNRVFAGMAAESVGSFTLTGKGGPQAVPGQSVTPDYFRVIGVSPELGRSFLPDENQTGHNHVVVLSDRLWRNRYHAAPNVLGRTVVIDGVAHTVIGVMPDRAIANPPGLWVPLVFGLGDLVPAARANHNISLTLARLKPGIALQQAQVEMGGIAQRLAKRYPKTNKGWSVTVLTLQEYKIEAAHTRVLLVMLMAIVGLVLLLACANVAGLLLARGATRTHELAIRSAMGASRARLLRQMLVENLLLALFGGGLGLLGSVWGIHLLRAGINFNATGRATGAGFRLDGPTLLFTLAAVLSTLIVFGLVPALQVSKTNPGGVLSESGRTGSDGIRRVRLRSALVVGEIALALVILAAAGVMAREMAREWSRPNGFNPQNLLITRFDVSSPRYKPLDARIAFFSQATEKVRNLPGVENAAVDSCVPMYCHYELSFDIIGRARAVSPQPPSAGFFVVGPNYFRTMQIPLLQGRGFSVADNTHSPIIAVVNRAFAQSYFPNGGAIGAQIEVGDGNLKRAEIAGVVGNVETYMGEAAAEPQIYESYRQIPSNAFSNLALIVRSTVAPAGLAPTLRRAVWTVDPDQPLTSMETMTGLVTTSAAAIALVFWMMTIFAGLALALAAVGIYGVIAFSATRRRLEIGVRVALGASRRDVLGMVMRQGGLLVGIGCAIGLLLALPLPHVFSALFDGFPKQGPEGAIAVAAVVAVVALLATYIPARRAARMDPMGALKHE